MDGSASVSPTQPAAERLSEPATDQELLAAHVAGDPLAFEQLVNRHRDRLWAVALRTTGDPEEAADGLQEALLSVFRSAGTFRGDAAVTTWLHRVVVNACLDRLRRRAARPTVPLPDEEDAGRSALADTHDPLSAMELRSEIYKALRELPPEQRAAIVLIDIEGYSVDEAAQILDCPGGTVKSRCARGRAKLAARLDPLRNPQPEEPVSSPTAEGGDKTR